MRSADVVVLTRSDILWRGLLLTLCVLGLASLVVGFFAGSEFSTSGLRPVSSAGSAHLQKVTVAPGSSAARNGLRTGDVIDTRPMSSAERYRLFNLKYRGELIHLYVVRPAGLSRATIVGSKPVQYFTWDVWIALAGAAWMLLFAGLLALRCPHSRDARVLALLLIGVVFQTGLTSSNWITPWAALDATAAVLSAVSSVCIALLATYSLSFARPASGLRRMLLWLSYAVAIAIAALEISLVVSQWTSAFDPTSSVFTSLWTVFVITSGLFVFPLLCAIVTAFETRGSERTRFFWAFVPLALFYIAQFNFGLSAAFYPVFAVYANAVSNAAFFLAPIGLTYSLLNRRLLDIGFALNRAAIFSGVSILLVGAFVLGEWLLSDWLQRENHSTNLIVSGALALVLGLSVRAVHGRVEHVVDHVAFRKRREDEEVMRTMAREAPYITERATLMARVEQALSRHADASFVDVVLDDKPGRFGSVGENDPAVVSLRAQHGVLDLHTVETEMKGEWAYPMVARGRLIGALILGPKRSGESYAPDESAVIAQLADSVAAAIDVFGLQQHDAAGVEPILLRIDERLTDISARMAEIQLSIREHDTRDQRSE
ncbi:MAG: hypothetical protein M3160_00645 [Candidatus Eremiobacteraeota bacterium]|nr:hypothetical protein [Candidatus Eremiobacteraeota bacterium]